MKFSRRDAIGLAGQQFFCSHINYSVMCLARPLGDPDVGLDAEIEILGSNGLATGRLLRAQVKSTQRSVKSNSTIKLYADSNHISYWNQYVVPVIFCVVSMDDKLVWWKEVTADTWQQSNGNSMAIELDTTHDLLTFGSKTSLNRVSMGILAPALEKFQEVKAEILDYEANRFGPKYDILSYDWWSGWFGSHFASMREACQTIAQSRLSSEIEKVDAKNYWEKFEYYWRETEYVAERGQEPSSRDLDGFIGRIY